MPAFFHMSMEWIRAETHRNGVASCRAYMTRARHRDVRDRSPVIDVVSYMKRNSDVAAARAEVAYTEFFSRGPMSACDTWNAIDRAARRADGKYSIRGGHFPRLAVFGEASFPLDMSDEHAIHCAREFAKRMVDRFGCAVEIACHRKGDRIDHVHFLISTRRVDECGVSSTTIREMNGIASKIAGTVVRDGDANLAGHAEWMRETWAAILNENSEHHIDHRSFKRQGIDIQPTKRVSRKRIEDEARRGLATWRDERAAFIKDRNQTQPISVSSTTIVRHQDGERQSLFDHVREQLASVRALGRETKFGPLVAIAIEGRVSAVHHKNDRFRPIHIDTADHFVSHFNAPMTGATRDRKGCLYEEVLKALSPSHLTTLASVNPIIAMAVAARLVELQATRALYSERALEYEDGSQTAIVPAASTVRRNFENVSQFDRIREQLFSVHPVSCGTMFTPFVAMAIEARASTARRESDHIQRNHVQNTPPSFQLFEEPVGLSRRISNEGGCLFLNVHKAMSKLTLPSVAPFISMAISARVTALQVVRARSSEFSHDEIAPDCSHVPVTIKHHDTAQLEPDHHAGKAASIDEHLRPQDGFSGVWFAPGQTRPRTIDREGTAPKAKSTLPTPIVPDWPWGDTPAWPKVKHKPKPESVAAPMPTSKPSAEIPGGIPWLLEFAAAVESDEALDAVRGALEWDAERFARMRGEARQALVRKSVDLDVIRDEGIAVMGQSNSPALRKIHKTITNLKVDGTHVRVEATVIHPLDVPTAAPLVRPTQTVPTNAADLASPRNEWNAGMSKTAGRSSHVIRPRVPGSEPVEIKRSPGGPETTDTSYQSVPERKLKHAPHFLMDENAEPGLFDGRTRPIKKSDPLWLSPSTQPEPAKKDTEDETFGREGNALPGDLKSETAIEKVPSKLSSIESLKNEGQGRTPNAAEPPKRPSLSKTSKPSRKGETWER